MTSSSSSARPTRADAGALSARSDRPARAADTGCVGICLGAAVRLELSDQILDRCAVSRLRTEPRALAALLRLDFRTALRFHPMVFVLPPVVLYALFGKKPLFGSKNLERVLLWSVIVLDIAIWLIRPALHDPLIF